jgi:DNA repair protein RadC
MRYQRAELPLKLDGIGAAREFFAGCFAEFDPRRESLWVAHIDHEARCLHVSCHKGDETGVSFPLRRIVTDAWPTTAPALSWHTIIRAAMLVQAIATVDHLVFAGRECASLRSLGYL